MDGELALGHLEGQPFAQAVGGQEDDDLLAGFILRFARDNDAAGAKGPAGLGDGDAVGGRALPGGFDGEFDAGQGNTLGIAGHLDGLDSGQVDAGGLGGEFVEGEWADLGGDEGKAGKNPGRGDA